MATKSTSPLSTSSRSRSGKLPFVSSFTAKPARLMRAQKSAKSGWSSGSPPVMHTPSSRPCRLSRNAKNSSTGVSPVASLGSSTSAALWQKEQRKLQPGRNTVAAVCSGKSSNVSFCNPAILMGRLLGQENGGPNTDRAPDIIGRAAAFRKFAMQLR